MQTIFPGPVTALPEAEVPIDGVKAFLSQGNDHQVIFMEFAKDVELKAHSHKSQWGIVLEGKVDLTIGDMEKTYGKGDRYYVPDGVSHHGHIYAGLTVIEYFDQKDRYHLKKM
jgi:quercetin dioxygenase-like cupin family protein